MGKWSFDGETPTLPGVYFDYRNTEVENVSGGIFGTVGMPIVADWGPIDTFTTIRSAGELENVFGPDDGTGASTSHLVNEVLKAGAKEVLVLRIGDGTEAAATKVLGNVTPTATALTLTAKYKGTRGNNFTVTVRENPGDNTKNDLIIYENGVQREIYTHVKASVTALGATINDKSALVTATVAVGNVALATVTGSAFTGGDSGSSVVAGDYVTAQDAFEREGGFDVYVMDGIGDSAINTAAVAWIESLNEAGLNVYGVIGGPTSESVSTGISVAQGYDSEYITRVGGGDVKFVLADGTEVTRSTAKGLAQRVAGLIAAAGITGSITRAEVPGISYVTPLTLQESKDATAAGLLTLTKVQRRTVVMDGITTFSSFTAEKDETFATISNIRAMQLINVDLENIFETEFIGKIRNTETGRSAAKARLERYFAQLEAVQVLVPETVVSVDTRRDNTGYSMYFVVEAQFGLELKKVLLTIRTPLLSA